MRVRHLLLGTLSGLFGVGLLAVGCGGTTQTAPVADSGAKQDVAVDAPMVTPMAEAGPDTSVDASVDASDAGSTCADASLANLPDASLADASSVGVCSACVQTTCSAQVTACTNDCDCGGALSDLFACFAKGKSLITCGTPIYMNLSGDSQMLALAVVECIDPSFFKMPGDGCTQECAIGAFLPKDAGKDSATSDAGGDAESDATGD